MRYSVVLHWDEDAQAWTAVVPALDGAATYGDTVEEALKMAWELIALNIVDLREHGEPVPVETVLAQVHTVEVTEADLSMVITLPHEAPPTGPKQP